MHDPTSRVPHMNSAIAMGRRRAITREEKKAKAKKHVLQVKLVPASSNGG